MLPAEVLDPSSPDVVCDWLRTPNVDLRSAHASPPRISPAPGLSRSDIGACQRSSRLPTKQPVAVLVLEPRLARASVVAAQLRRCITLRGPLRCQLDPLRQRLKLGLPATKTLAPNPLPLLGDSYRLFPIRNLSLSSRQLLMCPLCQQRRIVTRGFRHARELPVHQSDNDSTQ